MTALLSRVTPTLDRPLSEKVFADRSHLPVIHVPSIAFTLQGFSSWATSDNYPQGLRASFIDGEIYLDMSGEELQTHLAIKGEVYRSIATLNRTVKLGMVFPDGALVTNELAALSSEPDATFASMKCIRSGRVNLIPREGAEGQYMQLMGTPDWVLEVVSDSSVKKDTVLLRQAYYRAGIREYWLIDARGKEIDFQILQWRKSGYVAAPKRSGWRYSRIFKHEFQLVRERNELDLWEYTLRYRPR